MRKIFQKARSMLKIGSKPEETNLQLPSGNTYKILVAISSIVITAAIGYFITQAGTFTPSGAPGDTMYTLDDIYCKLAGCSTSTVYTLDSPGSPTSTMYTLQQIYDATPDFKNSPGDATAGDVFSPKTFYTNSNTRQTGTVSLTGSAQPTDVVSGKTFYNTTLTPQTGTVSLTGTAVVGTVLSGNTFYSNSLTQQTGTGDAICYQTSAGGADCRNGATDGMTCATFCANKGLTCNNTVETGQALSGYNICRQAYVNGLLFGTSYLCASTEYKACNSTSAKSRGCVCF